VARIADLAAVVPAITGKIELVYEGEQEGPEKVAQHLIGLAVRNVFAELFPDPAKARKRKRPSDAPPSDPYARIVSFFEGDPLDLLSNATDPVYRKVLSGVPSLVDLVLEHHPYLKEEELYLWAEFVLHGLAEHSRIGRSVLVGSTRFQDLFNTMMPSGAEDAGEDDRQQ
jgi:magnesium chelatase subunit I